MDVKRHYVTQMKWMVILQFMETSHIDPGVCVHPGNNLPAEVGFQFQFKESDSRECDFVV